jgi:hypothetical protein
MKPKKTLLLVLTAVVVCLLVYFSEKGGKSKTKGSDAEPRRTARFFTDVAPETVARIEIFPAGKQEPIQLDKVDGEWKVKVGDRFYGIEKYRADNLFGQTSDKSQLRGPITAELQAQRPENHANFDLTDDKAIRVTYYDAAAKRLEDVLIGKNGTDWQSTYIRKPGMDEVYLVALRLNDKYRGDEAKTWRDRRLFPTIQPETIYHLSVDDRANTRTYALAKRPVARDEAADPTAPPQSHWWLLDPIENEAQPSICDSIIRSLANLSAADFITSEEQDDARFDPPTLIATFSTADYPTSVVLTVGPESKTSGRYYAKTNISDDLYYVTRPYSLERNPYDLMVTPIPTPPPSPSPSPVSEEPAPEAEIPEETQEQSDSAPAETIPPPQDAPAATLALDPSEEPQVGEDTKAEDAKTESGETEK